MGVSDAVAYVFQSQGEWAFILVLSLAILAAGNDSAGIGDQEASESSKSS